MDMDYEKATLVAEEHKKKLNKICEEIKRLEDFLQTSGFVPYGKEFFRGKYILSWTGERLCIYLDYKLIPLLETKANYRIAVFPFLAEFFNSLVKLHEDYTY